MAPLLADPSNTFDVNTYTFYLCSITGFCGDAHPIAESTPCQKTRYDRVQDRSLQVADSVWLSIPTAGNGTKATGGWETKSISEPKIDDGTDSQTVYINRLQGCVRPHSKTTQQYQHLDWHTCTHTGHTRIGRIVEVCPGHPISLSMK